jgi:hypothetical protein
MKFGDLSTAVLILFVLACPKESIPAYHTFHPTLKFRKDSQGGQLATLGISSSVPCQDESLRNTKEVFITISKDSNGSVKVLPGGSIKYSLNERPLDYLMPPPGRVFKVYIDGWKIGASLKKIPNPELGTSLSFDGSLMYKNASNNNDNSLQGSLKVAISQYLAGEIGDGGILGVELGGGIICKEECKTDGPNAWKLDSPSLAALAFVKIGDRLGVELEYNISNKSIGYGINYEQQD